MTHYKYNLIPVIFSAVLIPQLLFWWLAPQNAEAFIPVYIFGTLLTLGIPVGCLFTYFKTDHHRTAGLFVISSVLEAITILIAAVLLAFNQPIRTAIFVFATATLIYLILLIPMITSALRTPVYGIEPAPIMRTMNEEYIYERPNPVPEHRIPVNGHVVRDTDYRRPLPPRRR